MYVYYSCYLLFIVRLCHCSSLQGWSYINLHCRNNDNEPVDWWYLYKPAGFEYINPGRNFTFITSENKGRWQASNKYITATSMLQNTLSPIFRDTYKDHLAVVVYQERSTNERFEGSSTFGILITDELGGLWIGHTVPGLPDMSKDKLTFPDGEMSNGHLLMCLSLDLMTLNKLALIIKQTEPRFTYIHIPPNIEPIVPTWMSLNTVDGKTMMASTSNKIDFITRGKSLRAVLLVRRPGEEHCLYREFARSRKIVLDVYGDVKHKVLCHQDYSVRHINSISIKYINQVIYSHNNTDKFGFGVSTAAHWQRKGSGGKQYWTCTGSREMGNTSGLLVCVEDYHVWLTFDNLKVKEPEC